MLAPPGRFFATLLPLLLWSVIVCAQSARGVVVDQTNLPLPGVRIELVRDERVVDVRVTEADGTFALPAFQPGDRLDAILDGFETAKVLPDEAQRITMVVGRTSEVTEVVAAALTSSGAAMERLGSTMSAPLAQRLPTPRPHILQALPLLPGVVRGRDGQLRIGGTRPHESSLWIDGFDVTDPVTGTSALDLPDESVKGMAVLRDPISATFSGVLGSLASIETATGGEMFKAGVQGFIPRPRLSGLGLGRIEAFFPRAYASGRAGAVRYFGSVEFNFERVPVPGVTGSSGSPNTGATGIISFARADVELSPRHSLTLEGLFAPVHTSNADLSPLRGPETTPQIDSQDFFAGLVDRVVLGPSDLLTIRVGILNHQTTIEPAGRGAALLTPTGWSQNWFAASDTSGLRQSLSVTWDRSAPLWSGTHALSLSTDLRHREMTSTVAHEPIRILDSEDRLVRRIDFGPPADLQADDLLGGLGLRDLWDVTARLQLDLGARIDWGLRRQSPTLSPRFGLRYNLDEEGRTVIKGSAGLFVGRAPLGALAFGQFPKRLETTFDPATGQATDVHTLTLVSTPLVLPRATGLALALEHQIRPGLEAQLSVRQRLGSSLPTVEVPAGGGLVPLTHLGTSTYREFQVSIHQTWRDDRQLFLSYVRASSSWRCERFRHPVRQPRRPIARTRGHGADDDRCAASIARMGDLRAGPQHRRLAVRRLADGFPLLGPGCLQTLRGRAEQRTISQLLRRRRHGLQDVRIRCPQGRPRPAVLQRHQPFQPARRDRRQRVVAVRNPDEQLWLDAGRIYAGQMVIEARGAGLLGPQTRAAGSGLPGDSGYGFETTGDFRLLGSASGCGFSSEARSLVDPWPEA